MDKLRYLAARFKEPSSWAGISSLLLGLGMTQPEVQVVALLGAGACGALALFLPEQKK